MTRWAVSGPCVHLAPEGGELPGEARCGEPLPAQAQQFDQPPPGSPCERCRLIFITDRALHALAIALANSQIPDRSLSSQLPQRPVGLHLSSDDLRPAAGAPVNSLAAGRSPLTTTQKEAPCPT